MTVKECAAGLIVSSSARGGGRDFFPALPARSTANRLKKPRRTIKYRRIIIKKPVEIDPESAIYNIYIYIFF